MEEKEPKVVLNPSKICPNRSVDDLIDAKHSTLTYGQADAICESIGINFDNWNCNRKNVPIPEWNLVMDAYAKSEVGYPYGHIYHPRKGSVWEIQEGDFANAEELRLWTRHTAEVLKLGAYLMEQFSLGNLEQVIYFDECALAELKQYRIKESEE